ncbi:MAG: AAA family ATPase [Chitinophagaceae bacterium]|nr:AAA family ATPase [Chitinophagaceae bacterium]MCW5927362.1 AAA family ATPase [Chitinophagaceae bacterium]
MVKAFVFGKFLPFHKGHEAMIRFALKKADFLTVLVCCSNRENISGPIRKQWIEKTFKDTCGIEVRVCNYRETDLPNTSRSSKDVSRVWAALFKKELPGYRLLVTSEEYGDYVASFMNIEHIMFDKQREQVPVAATVIRSNISGYWDYLPDAVKPFFCLKVVILGTESTGKTILTERLATYFQCSKVPEVGRELIGNSNDFSVNDLYRVAEAHAARIDKTTTGNNRLIIIDTDIHITQSYAGFRFGKELTISDAIYASNKAGLYLYLNNDVPFEQDGTRLDEEQRNLLDISHRQVLFRHCIAIREIKGDWDNRFHSAVAEITRFLEEQREPQMRNVLLQ